MPKTTTATLRQKKADGAKVTMLTAYDYATARLVDAAGIDVILVGDSLGNTILGYETTLPVTMEEMLHHTAAVTRGASDAMVIADMPFMTYQIGKKQALGNAGRFLKKTGCHAVKLEGGVQMAKTVAACVGVGIPVCGHIGLTPQSVHQFGGFRVQGRQVGQAKRLLADAEALDEAGAFMIVLECVPADLARIVTERVEAVTIGIGAGAGCDGQVQVLADILGLAGERVPKHAKRYADVGKTIAEAIGAYKSDVEAGAFPTDANAFGIDEGVLAELRDKD